MPPSGFRSFLPTWHAQIMGTISPGATSRVPTRLNMQWARRDRVTTFATLYRIILMATQAWGLSKFARAHFVSPSTGFILVSAYYNLPFITIFVNLGLFQHFETVTNIRTWIKSHRYWRML
jgi:hypothetical protein